MKQKLLLLLMSCCLTVATVHAQQRMQYSQYMLNSFLLNPALAGTEQYLDTRIGYSHQWAGFKGAPKGVYLSLNQGLYYSKQETTVVTNVDKTTSLPTLGRGAANRTIEQSSTTDTRVQPALNERMHLGVGGTAFSEITGPLSVSG